MDSSFQENKNKKVSKGILDNIKSNYILRHIFKNLLNGVSLTFIKYNKKLQKRLNICSKDYEKLSEIEIELLPTKEAHGKFINILNKEEEQYYHIYFNDNKEEIRRYYLTENDKVTKIKIIIDYPIKSLFKLFLCCFCIENLCFKKFYRNNINNIGWMFSQCISLKEINLCNFNTKEVINMSDLFSSCKLLKEINLKKFNTDNVNNMNSMFYGCSSIKKLDLSISTLTM